MPDKKTQTDLAQIIKNKTDNQKAGYGGRSINEKSKNSSSEEE